MKAEIVSQRDRDEEKLQREYRYKAQEDCLLLHLQNEEKIDKKEMYMRELKERYRVRLLHDKSAMQLEL